MFFLWQNKENFRRKISSNKEISKIVLKGLLHSDYFNFDNKLIFYKWFYKSKIKSSFRRSCLFTGHSRSVFQLFKLSRHQSKSMASNGLLSGFRKSSF